MGMIAQEVEKVFPNFVGETDAQGRDKEITRYGKAKCMTLPFDFDAYLVEAIKELKSENDLLKQDIKEVNAENEQLRETILALADRQDSIEEMLLALSTDLPKEKMVNLDEVKLDEVQRTIQ